MDYDTAREQAKKIVEAKKGFWAHFSSFLGMALFFFIINLLTLKGDRNWWFYWPILPWSIAVLIHYLAVYGFPGFGNIPEWEQREIEKETRRILYEEGIDIYEETEELDSLNKTEKDLELKDFQKEKLKRWNEKDFI